MKPARLTLMGATLSLVAVVPAVVLFLAWDHVRMHDAVAVALAILLVLVSLRAIMVRRRRFERAEETLRAVESRSREMFESTPIGLSLLDGDGRILETNPAYRRALGCSQHELGGKAIWDLIHPDDAPAARAFLTDLLRGGRARSREERLIHQDGKTIWSRSTYSLLSTASGEPQLVLGTLEDITQLRANESRLKMQDAPSSVLHTVTSVLAEDGTLVNAIPRLLQAICEGVGWDVGTFWMLDGSQRVLWCPHVWHTPSVKLPKFSALARQSAYACGMGFPGRVWERGQPVWLSDGAVDDDLVSKAFQEGLRTGFWAPISHGSTLFGVLAVLSHDRQDQDEELARAMITIAAGIAELLDRRRSGEAVRTSAAYQRWVIETTKEAIVTIDEQGRIVDLNPAVEGIFGYTRQEMLGQPLTMLMPENQRQAHRTGLRRYLDTGERRLKWDKVEFPGLHKKGHEILLEISFAEFVHQGKRSFTGFLRDVTERRQTEAALTYQALHDALTDLPNRNLLRDRLQQAVLVARRHNQPLSLLFIDLDRFKDVNDTLGHHSGDLLLQQVALRIRAMLRESDTVARLGGDEFGVVLPATAAPGAAHTADRILSSLKQPFVLEGHVFGVGASIGIAVYPHHGEDAPTLMRRADVAMYMAKRTESGHSIYTPDQDENMASRLLLAHELRFAVDSGQLLLYYQPKVNLQTGATGHAEALIRWRHPDRGMIPPDGFIWLAEETELIRPVTQWALNEALRQSHTWRLAGVDVTVAVNLSTRTLHDPQLLNTIAELLDRWEAGASTLEVEITESAIMIHPDRAMKTLIQLHDMGVSISIDDFGTGYSSLGYLKRLPAHEIKIDKAFVLDMATNRDDASIVRSVIDLSHNLGLQVVAEGVENKQTLDMLAELGCDMAQGYYLSPPIPAAQFVTWLNDQTILCLPEVS